MIDNFICPCYSGRTYGDCCQPFHQGELPATALLLMRSRFSAFPLRLVDYLIKTTHPASPYFSDQLFNWKRHLLRRCEESTYDQLEIHDFKENGSIATVVFTVQMTQQQQPLIYTERSYFEKIKGKWLYRIGQFAEGREPSLIPATPPNILPLAYYNNPILRRIADPIFAITQEIKSFIQAMIETMEADNGAGLAAPQVHQSIRVFIMKAPIKDARGEFHNGHLRVCINPQILTKSEELWEQAEGCLSIPGIHLNVNRPKQILVEYTNLEGILIQEQLDEYEAKAFQHENDHLNGILYIDHLDHESQKKLQPYLEHLEKRIQGMNNE